MGRRFNTARRTGTTVPRIQEILYETGETFSYHALVVLNANGKVVECGADPTSVTGVAMNGVGTKPGYDLPNASVTNVVTGRIQAVSVALADREQEFSARGVNGVTDPVVPLQSHIGQQYGVLKTSGGDWVIDFSDQNNPVVEITDIEVDGVFFFSKFLAAIATLP